MIPERFANWLPVKVRFGPGVANTLPEVLAEIGALRVFVMVDEGIENFNPAAGACLSALSAMPNLVLERFDKPAAEPTIDMVDAATAALTRSGAQAVIALGGGSVMDTAKAARLCAQLGMGFREFLATSPGYPVPEVPLICLPTSSGTGSEVSGGSVVSDPEAGRKSGIANAHLRAQYALVDPELAASMPPSMTAHTGIDAMAQAMAGILASVATPIGDGIGYEAIRLMAPALVRAYRHGTDLDARSAMSCGSMMAGLTMNISDCTAEHSLGQAIGGIRHVPHGLTIGLVLAEVLARETKVVPDRLERIADAMGIAPDGTTDGSRLVRGVRQLLADLDFPVLSSLEITEADLEGLTDAALSDFFITMAPAPWSRDEVLSAFKSALALESR